MADQFLTLMADFDNETQARLAGWYRALREAGFTGVQTPDVPYHISLATFPTDWEKKALKIAREAAAEFAPVPVHISHIGMFAGGTVLFACKPETPETWPWTPHVSLLIDEPETGQAAIPVLVREFTPFVGTVTRLHLCAFWPTREIAAIALTGGRKYGLQDH